MRNTVLTMFFLATGLFLSGCQSDQSSTPSDSQLDCSTQLQQVRQENQQYLRKISQLNGRIDRLSGFSGEQRLQLVRVKSIETGRYTGGYDENGDGVDDGVKLYLIFRDYYDDVIKAAGQVRVELWDLAESEPKQLMARWEFNTNDLQERWLTGLMSQHYKFVLPWPDGVAVEHENLTVKLVFTETLTGRTFEIQKLLGVSVSSDNRGS